MRKNNNNVKKSKRAQQIQNINKNHLRPRENECVIFVNLEHKSARNQKCVSLMEHAITKKNVVKTSRFSALRRHEMAVCLAFSLSFFLSEYYYYYFVGTENRVCTFLWRERLSKNHRVPCQVIYRKNNEKRCKVYQSIKKQVKKPELSSNLWQK